MLTDDAKIPSSLHEVYELTPPRRRWIHLGKKGRNNQVDDNYSQTISTCDRTYKSVLWRIIKDKRTEGVKYEYLDKLDNFIHGVKQRILDVNYVINTPKIVPILKKKKGSSNDEYRPICIFEDLYDAVIIVLANRYLSKLFDKFFYVNSLAFRPEREFQGEITVTFHHHAVDLIKHYLKINKKKIYVAECDMQKFYDTVDHKVVKDEFDRLLSLCKHEINNISFDEIINKVINTNFIDTKRQLSLKEMHKWKGIFRFYIPFSI